MNKPIEVGCLVMVVKGLPCGCVDRLGLPFTVLAIGNWRSCTCGKCGGHISDGKVARGYFSTDITEWALISTLKRIDPPASSLASDAEEERVRHE